MDCVIIYSQNTSIIGHKQLPGTFPGTFPVVFLKIPALLSLIMVKFLLLLVSDKDNGYTA